MTIPIFNLTRQYKTIKKEIDSTIQTVLSRGNFILGTEVSAFEREFATYINVPYAVGVASGTDALTLSLQAFHIGIDDEVIVPANVYPTAFGIAQAGVSLRLIDCGPDGNINRALLPTVITKKTKAIIAVHLYGNPCDVIGIQKVLKKIHREDIKIIEDCAQAHGAVIGKKKVGTFGDIACFSFYPSKNLGAYGDGGMIITRNKKIAERIRALRMYGETKRYRSEEVSGVSRLDELQAAILRVKLKRLDRWNKKRKDIATVYMNALSNVFGITCVPYAKGSCYHLFVIRMKKRAAFMEYMKKHGVKTNIHYPYPIHLVPAFKYLGYKKGDFPMAETLSNEIVSLPLYPELTLSEIKEVIASIKKFFQ